MRCWMIAILAVLALCRFMPARTRCSLAALSIGTCVFLLIPFYGVSTAWFQVGFEFGTRKFFDVFSDEGDNNIPRILQAIYRWSGDVNEPVSVIFLKSPVPFRQPYARNLHRDPGALRHRARPSNPAGRDARFLAAMVATHGFVFFCS